MARYALAPISPTNTDGSANYRIDGY